MSTCYSQRMLNVRCVRWNLKSDTWTLGLNELRAQKSSKTVVWWRNSYSITFASFRGWIAPSLPLHPPHPKQISWKTFWLSSHPLGKATGLLSQSAVSLKFTARWTALMARRWRSAQLSSFQASSHKDELLALLPTGGYRRHIACPWKSGFPAVQIIELCWAPYLLLSPQSTGDSDLVHFLCQLFSEKGAVWVISFSLKHAVSWRDMWFSETRQSFLITRKKKFFLNYKKFRK